ncbi:Aste57867_24012 [Aphanomyces stellatus]|uniref:Aste57867_24012 protein n=1 Tax=Aphanomyces stellatus TaxID=120398 RepID=A0A485LP95_9STRA|nr:hypothetical protein As57867_023939 [Aphanomyces stellatus]VFU00655.1 Aste57867_24012 [Aphanomyces stellatus]
MDKHTADQFISKFAKKTTTTMASPVANFDKPPAEEAAAPSTTGRKMMFVGLGLVVLTGAAIGIWQGTKSSSSSTSTGGVTATTVAPTPAPTPAPTRKKFTIGKIEDGSTRDATEENNPLNYTNTQGCYLPNYISKKGQLFIVDKGNQESPITIKGINWFGMETINNIPFGLWTNEQNGTTLFEIAAFLHRNQFNSVRLPLSVSSILNNTAPNKDMVHQEANAAIDLTNYTSTIGSIVQGLASRGISVLLDIHNLDPYTKGEGWYGNMTTEDDTLKAMDVLTSTFCNDQYWNIVGVDLKNEPFNTTWGDNGPLDFHVGAAKLGNRMLAKCANWMAFVEGNALKQNGTYAGQPSWYFDWWGGGLRNAGQTPLKLSADNKIVYAPHYYSPSVYPQDYLVQGGKHDGDVLIGYKEWDDPTLEKIVQQTADEMFGYLTKKQDGALVLGEFGGLYRQDAHEKKTNQRVIQNTIKMISTQAGYAGGYVWSLNPESGYEYNPSSVKGYWKEGLLDLDWVHVNTDLLKALEGMNVMSNLKPFPCLKK